MFSFLNTNENKNYSFRVVIWNNLRQLAISNFATVSNFVSVPFNGNEISWKPFKGY